MSRQRAFFVFPSAMVLLVAWGLPAFGDLPPYNPRVEAQVSGPGNSRVMGFGWSDATVDVAVNGIVVGNDVGTAPVQVQTPLAGGDVVTVTGNDTGKVKTLAVADHRLLVADIPSDVVTGTTSIAPESTFLAWATEPSSPQVTPTVDAAGNWTADFRALGYDLVAGPGIQVRQDDADGDGTLTILPVANPLVEIWDTHGVAASGWLPNAPLTITVDDPTDGAPPFVENVSTDGQGGYWDPLPDGWSPMQPGWIATATGAVQQRETPTITKTLVVPDPIPVPDISGTVVSDVVTSTLTATSVGKGGRVEVVAWCAGGTGQGTTRSTTVDLTTGAFSLDMAADPVPPVNGFGDVCSGPIQNVLYRLYDADGDMFQMWWLPDVAPSLSLQSDIVVPGDSDAVTGTGWDLGTVTLVQCRLAGDVPDYPGGCDFSGQLDVLTSPSAGWPYATSEFGEQFQPALQLTTANGPVDCSTQQCAIVGFEPWRPGAPIAWGVFTFTPSIDVTASAKGTVSTVTGSATIGGTLTASAPVMVHLSGELRQRFSRTRVVVGWFDTWVWVDGPGTVTTWSAVVQPQTGQAFGSGKAELTVFADLGEQGGSGDQDVVTVSLTAAKPRRH